MPCKQQSDILTVLQREEVEPLEAPTKSTWVLLPDILALLGKMAHDCLIGVRTDFGCIGVGEALKGVAVAGLIASSQVCLTGKPRQA
jgi:hypothetical protein